MGMYAAGGIQALSGGKPLFLNATHNMLVSGLLRSLPPDLVVIEVLEDVPGSQRLLHALRELREAGFMVALDDWQDDPERAELIGLADIIKLEIGLYSPKELADLAHAFQAHGIRLLAEKVETAEEHRLCRDLGFSYFQGYFYARPETVAQQRVTPGRLAALRLLSMLQDERASTSKVASLVESDPALSLKVLRFSNSAQISRARRFSTIREAVVVLGTRRIQDIATLTVMSGVSPKGSDGCRRALIRARACELLADHYGASPRAAFLAGMLSAIELMLDVPLSSLLDELPVEQEIRDALLGGNHSGISSCLKDARAFEQAPEDIDAGQAPTWRFSRCYLEAITWANNEADELGLG